jgi:BMFP domain-containing protein YqiC
MAIGPISTRTGSMAGKGRTNSIACLVYQRRRFITSGAVVLPQGPRLPIVEETRAPGATEVPQMTQTSNRIFDEMARLMTDAASVAQGVRREAETAFRSQVERFIAGMDLVKREDFEVVREMAAKARAENESLAARVADLEARLGEAATKPKRSVKGEPASE